MEILQKAEKYAKEWFVKNQKEVYTYHTYQHTIEVRDFAIQIAEQALLNDEAKEILILATLFHDMGYFIDAEAHEEASVIIASKWLEEQDVDADKIGQIRDCILATHIDAKPKTILQKIMKDADLAHIGTDTCFQCAEKLYEEIRNTKNINLSKEEWMLMNLEFFDKHRFYTAEAKELFNEQKKRNENILHQKLEALGLIDDSSKKKKSNNIYSRGVETMFRVSLRNHNNLSRIADSKANIMLSITAIMLSLVLSSMATKLDSNPQLIIPTIIIITVCIVTMFFAILATRPNVTDAKYSRESFLDKKINLLFFGNFKDISVEEFEWGMEEMMKNNELLYSSLSKDLYYLGKVLAKKYQFLRICYIIFMGGLFISALSFIVAFINF